MAALPLSGIRALAGLALLGTISGSLYQALNHEAERDAAIVTFLMTASGVTLGIGSAFWGWCWEDLLRRLHAFAARSCDGVMPVMLRKRLLKWLAELNPQASAMSVSGVVVLHHRFGLLHAALHNVLMRRQPIDWRNIRAK